MQIVTSWMEQGIKQGLEQGMARGIERGLERGRQEGRQGGALSFVLRLLTRRFGPLATETQQEIEQLSLTQLEALGEDLLFFEDIGALEQWLMQS